MNSDDLFTAPQVAKICSTDLKTIHNWVNRGEINYFRTPGRHLRFRRQDILEFLDKFGYPVPDGFAPSRPKVVFIDSIADTASTIERDLSQDVDIVTFPDHFDALLSIGKERPALVLVNGEAGPDMMHVVKRISTNDSQLPVAVFGQSEMLRQQSEAAGATEFIGNTDSQSIRQKVVSLLGVAV